MPELVCSVCVYVCCVCVAWHDTVSGVGSSSGDIRYVILVSLQDSVWHGSGIAVCVCVAWLLAWLWQ